ncbi:Isocitrate/Isopropylmalate dehydrogenase-like protein, partial [Rozella allomycis CSF55]
MTEEEKPDISHSKNKYTSTSAFLSPQFPSDVYSKPCTLVPSSKFDIPFYIISPITLFSQISPIHPGSTSLMQRIIRKSYGTVVAHNKFQSPLKTSGLSYGGRFTVTLIPGDGIGQELCNTVKPIFKSANLPIDWEEVNVSGYKSDEGTFKAALESIKRTKVCLKGIIHTSTELGKPTSLNVLLRKNLDLYAGMAFVQNIPGIETRHHNVNFTIIRENTEGEYSGLEHQSYPGVVESLKVMTAPKCERIVRFAFDYAARNNRKRVTCIHKANIMKLGDGLFLNTFKKVAEEYKSSGIIYDEMIVDNASMQLVSKPQQFDVL